MSIRVEQPVAATREAVWERLADLASHPVWMNDALSVRFLSAQVEGVGTRMEVPTRIGPFRTADVMVVTEWDEPRAIGVDHQGLVSGTGRFTLEGTSPTTVVWTETLRFPWWLGGRVTASLAAPFLRGVWRKNLGHLSVLFRE